jgi:hypothetical protein
LYIGGLESNIHCKPVSAIVEERVLEIHICSHVRNCQIVDAEYTMIHNEPPLQFWLMMRLTHSRIFEYGGIA